MAGQDDATSLPRVVSQRPPSEPDTSCISVSYPTGPFTVLRMLLRPQGLAKPDADPLPPPSHTLLSLNPASLVVPSASLIQGEGGPAGRRPQL